MQSDPPRVRALHASDGSTTYLIDATPESLPPVRSGDLADAWDAARTAALSAAWGSARRFRFMQPDGSTLDLALDDDDACCWVAAIDGSRGMHTAYGLSLCLRLLALVDLLARASWAGALYRLGRAGAALHPALVRTAATAPLTSQAAFDEAAFRMRLGAAAHARIPV